MQTGYEYA